MPTVTIERTDGDGDVAPGAQFTLQARVADGSASSYRWSRDGQAVAGATTASYSATASAETQGRYTVTATVEGAEVTSDEFEVKLGAADVSPPGEATTNAEVQPVWHRDFAIVTFVIAAALALALVLPLLIEFIGIDSKDWFGDDGDTAFAASLGLPLAIFGAVLLAVGTWMAVVEWRGRFKPTVTQPSAVTTRGIDVKPGEIIDALGKLRGPALVLVVGALLMLGAAWVAKSSAEEESSTGTTTTPTTTTTTPGTP